MLLGRGQGRGDEGEGVGKDGAVVEGGRAGKGQIKWGGKGGGGKVGTKPCRPQHHCSTERPS